MYCLLDVAVLRQQSSYKSGGKEEKLNFVRVAKSCGLLWSFGAESSNATETTAAVDERPRQRIGKREREREEGGMG